MKGFDIVWDHFEQVYQFNCLRIYRCLTKEHIEVTATGKMRNHLAINVLNEEMLNLMQLYQKSLANPSVLNGTIELLENMSVFTNIFSDHNRKITSLDDVCIRKILDVLHFFQLWESEFETPQDKHRHLITRETREDIDSSIYGFVNIVRVTSQMKIPLVPGYFNSDLIKNWFCQIHGLHNRFNQNPTLSQIGPSINANLLTGSVVSSKGNMGGVGRKSKGAMPPVGKLRKN